MGEAVLFHAPRTSLVERSVSKARQLLRHRLIQGRRKVTQTATAKRHAGQQGYIERADPPGKRSQVGFLIGIRICLTVEILPRFRFGVLVADVARQRPMDQVLRYSVYIVSI